MGFINSTVPVFQAEYSPKSSRGLYVCMQLSTLNFGIMVVYWIDYAFQTVSKGVSTSFVWRVPTILQCIFLIPMILLIIILPETPRWLAAHDRNDECLSVLQRLYRHKHTEEEIQRMHRDIVDTVALEVSIGSGSWGDLLKNDSIQSQRRLLIACGIQIFQQLGGINALICKLLTDSFHQAQLTDSQQTTPVHFSRSLSASTPTCQVSWPASSIPGSLPLHLFPGPSSTASDAVHSSSPWSASWPPSWPYKPV